jgi:membrane fusion protein (multidrug efflux system)
MRALLLLLALLVALALMPASAAEQGSVLVTIMMPRKGSLPDIATAYGTAGPAVDSSMTISLQSQGRVLRFDVTPGEAVKAGQPLLEFSVSESALGSYRQAEIALQTAKVERSRIAHLLKQQFATKDQLTQADKAIADAQTTLDTLKKSGSDQPDLTIKAPFDGVVSTIPVAQGDTIAPGAPMMTLMRADGLVVRVGIEPAQGLRMKRGDPVMLQPMTSGGAPASGTLIRIDGLLNPKTRLIDADVATSAHLLPGAAFKVQITVGHFDGFVVPRDEVLSDAKGAYVFQVGDGKAHRVAVTIVGSTGDQTAVTGAIDPAKPIVLQGNYQLEDGMEVRLSETETSAAAPAFPAEQ